MTDEFIITRIGGAMRVVDFELFSITHAKLADEFRSAGLKGNALDQAIEAALPGALARALGPTFH
jgi:hypothetical protein